MFGGICSSKDGERVLLPDRWIAVPSGTDPLRVVPPLLQPLRLDIKVGAMHPLARLRSPAPSRHADKTPL